MQSTRRYTLGNILTWQRRVHPIVLLIVSLPVFAFELLGWSWLRLPWEPISLIGIAVSFYLGFKNNSSYDRLWEARKIWGGIVNASRSFAVMAHDFVNIPGAEIDVPETQRTLIYRQVAWLQALCLQMRQLRKWEHLIPVDESFRKLAGTDYATEKFAVMRPYLSEADYDYLMTKGNKASHLISLQSRHIMELRNQGVLDGFRHQQLQGMLTEFYTLMGKSERIKNFPFPRQYASVNFYFVGIFVILIPFGLLDLFASMSISAWLVIPLGFLASWVFVTMEMIGDYSENPFEGLYNDVPILNIARGIEIDIRQMLEETELPAATEPVGGMNILV